MWNMSRLWTIGKFSSGSGIIWATEPKAAILIVQGAAQYAFRPVQTQSLIYMGFSFSTMSNHFSFQSAMLFFRQNFAFTVERLLHSFFDAKRPIVSLLQKRFIKIQIKKFERQFKYIYYQKDLNQGVRTYSAKRPIWMHFVKVPFNGIQNYTADDIVRREPVINEVKTLKVIVLKLTNKC